MNILVTHSSNFDYKNELYLPLRNSELNSLHKIILPHEGDSILYTRPIIENHEVELQLAEVSLPSTGQGIEMGWANAFNVPILCIFKRGTKYSGTLKVVTDKFIEYIDSSDMVLKLTDYLKLHEN